MNERFTRAAALAHIDLSHEPDFALGRLTVGPSRREIVADGRREIVDPRVMQVLVALARADGGVVSRDDLIESCWDGVVVGEDAITNCVGRLRKVAEATGHAFAIETVPRVGYRLRVSEKISTAEPDPRTPETIAPVTTRISVVQREPYPEAPPRVPIRWVAAISTIVLLILIAGGFALWRYWPSRPPAKPTTPVEASVAVLPFVNMSGDPKQEYFSDGFSEELINDLANEPRLQVASRTSSFAFKGRNGNIGTIASALNVHAIVEGSIRESGDRVRITAQLIDASSGYHLWSADYTRNLTDILSLQDNLAGAIASALTHQLVPAPARSRPRIDPAIYRQYLEGVHQFYEPAPMGWRNALAIFKQVTAAAPDFADGFAWLARIAGNLANYDAAPGSDIALANYAGQKALSLDPYNLMARGFRANMEVDAWNWSAAAADLRLVRSQNPNSYASINGLWYYYLNLGFPDQAFAAWQSLPAREPDTWRNTYFALMVLDEAGRFRQEIAMARAQLVVRPRDTSRLDHLCEAYSASGHAAEARGIGERLRDLQTDFDSQANFQDCEWYVDMGSGDHADALNILHVWEQEFPDKMVQATMFGTRYVILGDFDKASEWFERGYERRETHYFANVFLAACIDPSCIDLAGFGYRKAFEAYRLTAGFKSLAEKPLFRAWQAEHDRIAADLAAHRDPLN